MFFLSYKIAHLAAELQFHPIYNMLEALPVQTSLEGRFHAVIEPFHIGPAGFCHHDRNT